MPIDPTIPLQLRPMQIAPEQQPVNMLAKVLQIKGLQQENALGEMRMEEMRRGASEMNALARAYQTDGFSWDDPKHRQSAFAAAPTRAAAAYKGHLDAQKDLSEVEKRRFEVAKEGYSIFQRSAGALFNDPNLSRDSVVRTLQELEGAGVMSGPVVQRMIAQLPQDPQRLRMQVRQALTSQMTPEQMVTVFAPKPTQVDNGQQISYRDTNPNSPTYGQVTAGAPVQKVASPESVLSAQTQIRGQNMTDQRARERLQFEQGNAVAEAGGPGQALLVKRYGKAPNGYRWKPDGTQEAVPGGPADIKAGEVGVRRARQMQGALAQADRVIAKVDEALGKVGWNTAGLGSTMANMPGTDARDLRANLDTIKANLGFAELQAMREASPTGGALGAIAVQELIALQSTVASLDQAQSPAELERSLGQIRTHYENWRNAVVQSGNGAGGGDSTPPPQRPAKPAAPKALPANPTAQTLRNGEVYKLPNGKSGRWNGQAFEVVQ